VREQRKKVQRKKVMRESKGRRWSKRVKEEGDVREQRKNVM
jgi:hypothetical protein